MKVSKKIMSNAKKSVKTVNNENKVNEMLTTSTLLVLVNTLSVNYKVKVFTDNNFYVGIGNGRSNTFSINAKKTKYNIYCDTKYFDMVSALNNDNIECVKNGNSTDKTRPHYISTSSTDIVKSLIDMVLNTYDKVVIE